jgi:hypothetical protein
MRVATPDFAGAPTEGQQYQFFPDVSKGAPIWITLRQNLQRSKLTMIMRVSKETSQAEVEKAASIYWEQTVEFKNPPTVYDSNTIYWMKPHNDGPPDEDDDTQPEPDTLYAIPHVATPTFKPATCSFVRSLSSDDLSKASKAPAPQKSADCLRKWTVNFGLTVVTHSAPEDAPIEVVAARAATSIGLKETGWRIRQGDRWHIYCTDTQTVSEAAIHFGNMEWRGKVEPSYSIPQLIEGAQAQLEIPGQWQARSSHWEGQARCIECEQVTIEEVYPFTSEDCEVWFILNGCTKKAALPAGADQIAQAAKAQKLFNETLVCTPIVNAGDHYEIQLSRPKLSRSQFCTRETRRKSGAIARPSR